LPPSIREFRIDIGVLIMIIERRMTKNPVTCAPDMSIQDAADLMEKEHVHRLPVLDRNGKLVGVISEKDILKAAPSPASTLSAYETNYLLSKLTVKKIMSRNPVTVTKDTAVEDAAMLMIDQDLSCLPILEDGVLVGIVSKSDLFRMLLESFGSRVSGTALTFLVEDRKGILAEIIGKISEKGLDIISCSCFEGTSEDNRYIDIKVAGVTSSELIDIVKPFAIEVMDVKESK